MKNIQFLSRGIEYLGDLGTKLRDLQGFRTLAHELIQNADDASDATSMVFDFRDDALIVHNDGVRTSSPGNRAGAVAAGARAYRLVLRSYVPAPGEPPAAKSIADGRGDAPVRSPVDIAGVKRVLDYEIMCGRSPTEMHQTNPGFDVESREMSGEVGRYIEAKSLSCRWTSGYAVLSRSQFRKGGERWRAIAELDGVTK
jgi:hypothetical protein